jgi:radical SAM domain protein
LRGHFSRINFAGGEPTLSHDFRVLVEEAHSLGFVCSIITNGYLLARQPEQFSWLYERVHTIGVSIDSLDATRNRELGRCNKEEILQREEYKTLCSTIKARGVRLKINTVVSKLNLDEHFLSFYKEVSPDRLKLLQVFYPPQTSFLREEEDVSITEEEFNHFVKENTDETLRDILVVEDNEAMTNAYYLLESNGCFRDNGTGESSPSLLNEDVDVPKALERICIDKKKYNDRYQGKLAQME